MLGAYNVSGAPCELLVEQDAITWWPRVPPPQQVTVAGTRAGSHSPVSPLRQNLRRLSSEASSVILSSIQGDRAERDDIAERCRRQSAQSDKSTGKARRLEFSQIVGTKRLWVGKKSRKHRGAATRDQEHEDNNNCDKQTISDNKGARQAGEAGSQHRTSIESETKSSPSDEQALVKFKLYYVKRNDKKSSGRLLKLKKISIGLLEDDASGRHALDDATKAAAVPSLVGLYELIEQHLELKRRARPKSLLVFVNPYGGKGKAMQLYKSKVRQVLELAAVECELVVTQHANHARETIENPHFDLERFDGIVCVGGDGMFAELMNGLLFRCNRDKLLASELSSQLSTAGAESKRPSDSLSNGTNTNGTNDTSSSSFATDLDCSSLTIDTATTVAARGGRQQPFHSSSGSSANNTNNGHHHHQQQHQLGTSRHSLGLSRSSANSSCETSHSSSATTPATSDDSSQVAAAAAPPSNENSARWAEQRQQVDFLRASLGGIGEQFVSPSIPVGVIGAGSTDANLFGFIGTNDATSAALNIVLGNQMHIDVCSVHSIRDDRLLRFVSTFVAYGYFGDVIRESEKLRWLGPSRYDVTALNSLIKYRHYQGLVRILRSSRDGTPLNLDRCHLNCRLCGRHSDSLDGGDGRNSVVVRQAAARNHLPNSLSFDVASLAQLKACSEDDDDDTRRESSGGGGSAGDAEKAAELMLAASQHGATAPSDDCDHYEIIELEGAFVGVNAAVTACRCPQTRKGFSPGNHLANGCADLILVRPCSRMQYINYLLRTGYTKKSAFDLKYVEAYRCRQFEFIARPPAAAGCDSKGGGDDESSSSSSSWNADGEILREDSIRVKVNNRLLRVFGTGEPQRRHKHKS